MIHWIERKIWQIKNLFKWLPIIWNQYDFDYIYAINVFKFQLEKTRDYLLSDKAVSVDAKYCGKRLDTIIKLMTKVYSDEYSTEFYYKIEELYGKRNFNFIPEYDENGNEKVYSLSLDFEKKYSIKELLEIEKKESELMEKSFLKQQKAHKLLWKLIEYNIEKMWD